MKYITFITQKNVKYDCARYVHNNKFNKYPCGIIYPKNVDELVYTFKRLKDKKFTIRSGGHSYEGYSTVNNGYIIDISRLNDIDVDTTNLVAKIGAGVNLLDTYKRLWKYGMTISTGSCPTVGLGGLVLGGGFGLLSRKYGLTSDNVIQFDIIDWKGELLHVTKDKYPDLFWALCGSGGGNFGILTSITTKLIPIDKVSIYRIQWHWNDIREVINIYQTWAPYVDDNLTTILKLNSSKNGTILSEGQYLGSESRLRRILQPLLSTGSPFDVQISKKSFIDAVDFFADIPNNNSNILNKFKSTSAFLYKPLSSSAIDVLVDYLDKALSENCLAQFNAYGGFISSISPKATAFYHRNVLASIQYQAYWTKDIDEESHTIWINKFRSAMMEFTKGAYINFIDENIPLKDYYGGNYKLLKLIKKKYDPNNIFHFPMSIPLE